MTIGKKVLGIVISLIVVYVGLRIIGAGWWALSRGLLIPSVVVMVVGAGLVLFFALCVVACLTPERWWNNNQSLLQKEQ